VLQSKSQFHSGRGVVRLFGEGTSPWGQTLNPSLAHFIQLQRSLSIACPDAPLQATTGLGTLPHVMAPSTIRLHVDAEVSLAVRRAPGRSIGAILRCSVGDGCDLTIWGGLELEMPGKRREPALASAMTPALFSLAFWCVSRSPDDALSLFVAPTDKEARIRELEALAALSRCAQ
jgi:hypothetical protein